MWFNTEELLKILNGQKTLTIRSFKRNWRLPIKVGSKTYLKTGSFTSKERYGQIEIISAEIKPLAQITDGDALKGGYNCKFDYVYDQINIFNPNIDWKKDKMIFYEFKVLWTDKELIKSLV